MKKLLFLFIFITSFAFAQEKQLYRTVTYNEMVSLFNKTLKVKNEGLSQNIERCKYIIKDAESKQDSGTEIAFKMYLDALVATQSVSDKDAAYFSIYKDTTSYNFYDSKNQFVGRVYKEKLDPQIDQYGDKAETYISNYFYILQD